MVYVTKEVGSRTTGSIDKVATMSAPCEGLVCDQRWLEMFRRLREIRSTFFSFRICEVERSVSKLMCLGSRLACGRDNGSVSCVVSV